MVDPSPIMNHAGSILPPFSPIDLVVVWRSQLDLEIGATAQSSNFSCDSINQLLDDKTVIGSGSATAQSVHTQIYVSTLQIGCTAAAATSDAAFRCPIN